MRKCKVKIYTNKKPGFIPPFTTGYFAVSEHGCRAFYNNIIIESNQYGLGFYSYLIFYVFFFPT